MKNYLPISGKVRLKLNGKLICEGTNIVVTAGKNLITGIVSSSTYTRPGWIAVGDSDTLPADAQTALVGTEHFRQAIATTTVNGNQLTYTKTLTNSTGGSVTVKELGIFNAASGGDMLARFLSTEFLMANGDTLAVEWTLTFGG